jgi:ElaB/YqjD/DUF883 family membrane-anchored ribosome-binding protein
MDVSSKRKSENGEVDLDTIVADVATLKRDIAKILEHVKTATVDSAVDTAQGLAEELSDTAAGIYKDLSKRGQRTVKVVSRKVEDQPVMSLLVAFSVGLVVSRLISR